MSLSAHPDQPRPTSQTPTVQLMLNGQQSECRGDISLLHALRDEFGLDSPKDGCSPQGQCGCCTVLVDGAPRVACVTPVRRVAGREVTTLEGLDPDRLAAWAEVFDRSGASQCGFCTPGIICRLDAASSGGADHEDRRVAAKALRAHLCRCTGWQPILDAWTMFDPAVTSAAETTVGVRPTSDGATDGAGPDISGTRDDSKGVERTPKDRERASLRAQLEGGATQTVGTQIALGAGGFAEDTAPDDALVAVPDRSGGWVVAESLADARSAAGKVQGRRTTMVTEPPLEVPDGDWALTLRTSWCEPAYLETDASWCEPGGSPATPLANGGAFGAKQASLARRSARELADQTGRTVRVVLSREDVVRLGPKRPPLAAGINADGSGLVHVARTTGIVEAIASINPALDVVEFDLEGPPTSADIRGAGSVEAMVLSAAAGGDDRLEGSAGQWAEVDIDPETLTAGAHDRSHEGPPIRVRVAAGPDLDTTVLRSYCVGAVHQGLSWVISESIALDESGEIADLTVRSFGILGALAMPRVEVHIDADGPTEPAPVSTLVMAATALAAWRARDLAPSWPTGWA